MKRKSLLAGVLAGTLAAALSACGGGSAAAPSSAAPASEASSAAETKSDGKKVGISMPTKSLERWNRDGSYLEKQFQEKGFKTETTYADNKVDQQVKDLEGLIADEVDLLVVAAIDGESLSQVLGDAKDANIPVIAYDRLIRNTDAISYYVSFDNYKVGQLQGQFIIDSLKLDEAGSSTFNMEVTAGDPADNNATFFFNGAMDLLKPYIEKGTICIPSGQDTFEQCGTKQWDTATAMTRMQNILGSNYSDGTKLDIALCSNDSTALGVTQAIESDYAGDGRPLITGQDCDEANLANIVDGKQTMSVYKAVANEAVATLDLGEAILKGEKPDEKLIADSNWSFDCAYDTTSYDNGRAVIPSYLLTPVAVTKDNIQKELIDTGYYRMDGAYPKALA